MIPSFPTFPYEALNFKKGSHSEVDCMNGSLDITQAIPPAGKKPIRFLSAKRSEPLYPKLPSMKYRSLNP